MRTKQEVEQKIVISEKLVSAVLGVSILSFRLEDNELFYVSAKEEGWARTINLYEFIHKNCKEWALEKGYDIDIFYSKKGILIEVCKEEMCLHSVEGKDNTAIIQAIKWILEQIKQ